MKTFVIADEVMQKISEITNVDIKDDYSLDFAICEIMKMWNTQKESIAYLQRRLAEHGIKTVLN